MIKTITNSFAFDENSFRPITRRSRVKQASFEMRKYIKDVKSEPGRTKFLTLFLGAGEFYGPNLNFDWFGQDDLLCSYNTFVTHGHVYRHHKNKDPKKKYGDIEFAVYNNDMHRVEGVMSLIDEQCQDVLERVDNGENIPVSMAAKMPYDVCSICGNKASRPDKYCECIKENLGKIYPSGKMVYMINPNPKFFDISVVYKPADQTAYVLEKVASKFNSNLSHVMTDEEYYAMHNKIGKQAASLSGTREFIGKMAEIEKKVEGILSGKIDQSSRPAIENIAAETQKEDMSDELMFEIKKYPIDGALSSLSRGDVLLSPSEFLKLLGKEDMSDDVADLLPGIHQRLAEEYSDEDDLGFGSCPNYPHLPIIKKIISGRSMRPRALNARIMMTSLNPKPRLSIRISPRGIGIGRESSSAKIIVKKSNNTIADNLAKCYTQYKLAFCREKDIDIVNLSSILANYC